MSWEALSDKLADEICHLNCLERAVVFRAALSVADRLRLGRERYGELTHERIANADWQQQLAEEAIDAMAYLAMGEMQREKAGGK